MKNSQFIWSLLVCLAFFSCSEDLDFEVSDKPIIEIKQEIYDQGNLYTTADLANYSSIVIGDVNDYKDVSLQVFQAVAKNHPDSKIKDIVTYNNGDEYYSVLLNDDLEGVVFSTGHWLVTATEEKVISENEIVAGELPIDVLMRLYDSFADQTVEEIIATTRGVYEIDFKNGKSAEFDKSGNLKSHGNDDDGDDDGITIPVSSLPSAIIDYITMNYPGSTIIEAESYPNGYEVELNNGLKLEFDTNGNFIEVSGNNGGRDDDTGEGEDEDIDPSALPQAIFDYIETNYPGTSIVGAEIDPFGYEVTLNTGIKLEFDLNGNFIEVSGHSDDDKEDDGDSDDDEEIDPAALPQVIKDYIATNYPEESILRAELDASGYDVILSNGLKLEFDVNGNFIEISGGGDDDDDDDDDDGDEDGENEQDINPANLPQAALDFINAVCPNETIVKAEFYAMSQIYEVTMNSGLQFEFDNDGNFLDISGSDCDEIPTSSLPQNIRDYINNEFSSGIDKVKQCDYGYRVDLNDDTRIYLKSNGDVIYVGEDD